MKYDLYFKMINEENSVEVNFDNIDELLEFCDDCFGFDYNEINNDILRKDYKRIEVLVVYENNNKVFDYLR